MRQDVSHYFFDLYAPKDAVYIMKTKLEKKVKKVEKKMKKVRKGWENSCAMYTGLEALCRSSRYGQSQSVTDGNVPSNLPFRCFDKVGEYELDPGTCKVLAT